MTIEQMTYASHIFAAAGAVFAVLAAVLFFAFDMRRVWRVLYGGFGTVSARRGKKPHSPLHLFQNITYTEYQETVPLSISQCAASTLQIYRRKSYSKVRPDAEGPV